MIGQAYRITRAEPAHLPVLGDIERAAAAMFPLDVLPSKIREQVVPLPTLEEACRARTLWVALTPDDEVIGYLVAQTFGDELYVVQLDVLPAQQRRGIGRALVAQAIAHARSKGLRAVTLTTFRSVPWNGPWYRRLGFSEIPSEELSPHLEAQLAFEENAQLRDRIAMWRPL